MSLADWLGRESTLVRTARPLYESALHLAHGRRGIPWTINDVPCRVDPHQRHRLARAYEADVAAYLRARVRPGAVCLDVGANVGAYVLQLAHWSAPGGRVVAFEPNPGAVAVLRRHLAWNGLERRVDVIEAAVGERPGTAVLHAAAADGMSRLATPHPRLDGATRPLEVEVTSIDAVCAERGLVPDWLLIDVEGLELSVLEGARRTIAARRGALGIVVEMHPSVWPSTETTAERLERFLSGHGLLPRSLTGRRAPLAAHGIVALVSSSAPDGPDVPGRP